jgi:lipopolysaccharide transport system ATP-binding protein
MSDLAIRVENLGKAYQISHQRERGRYKTLQEDLLAALRWPGRRLRGAAGSEGEKFWALRDLSFEVREGEVLGIIGRNGAGKSTLLKILSRITEPTTGYADVYGRVGSLLEVGTGFHPELTGRENIFLNGAILGMTQREVQQRFDEIVAFAEVEQFLDTPVKRYSSGMYVRLAFAVAAHVEPEILVVDEVLAVGDAEFQKKCLGKMGDVARAGRTVLFVSHNMAAILGLCERVILLDQGRVAGDGTGEQVVNQYLRGLDAVAETSLLERRDRQGNGALTFAGYEARDAAGAALPSIRSGQEIMLAFRYQSARNQPLRNVHVALGLHGRFDENLAHLSTEVGSADFEVIPPSGTILCRVPRLPLQPGRYSFNLFCKVGGEIADWIQNAGTLEVEGGDFFGTGRLPPLEQGAFLLPHSWELAAEAGEAADVEVTGARVLQR